MAVAPFYLQDSSGQLWLNAATNDGRPTATPIPGSGPTSVLISDISSGQVWTITQLGPGDSRGAWGALHAEPTGGPASPIQIPIIAPNGTVFAIQIDSSVPAGTSPIQTAIYSPLASLCPFSLGDADVALATRLYDPTGQFWTQAERYLYLYEALRTWNALTGYWRGDFTFTTTSALQWYDMTSTAQMPNTLRPLTLTGTDLATMIEYHLLEPPVGAGTWTGSTQFNLQMLEDAITRRRNETLGTTGCRVSRLVVQATSQRIHLPSTTIDLRRVAYIPADGSGISVLWQDDAWAQQAFSFNSAIQPAGAPSVFTVSTEPFLTFTVDTPPLPGQFELLVVDAGFLSTANDTLASSLQIPDDWSWVIKWGALADLFGREGNAKDDLRREYCESRYRAGLKLLERAPALLAARIGNLPLEIDSVKAADEFNTDWEAQPAGSPTSLLVAGLNLIATAPTPDAGPYSLTLTVIENAPIPPTADTCLLLDRSLFDIIVDYAQHLAMLKCGGEEFLATQAHLTRFMQAAALYVAKYYEMGEYAHTLLELSQREEMSNPRYKSGMGIEAEQ